MSGKIVINKRVKGLPKEELEKLTKTELIDKIVQLEAYNFQLKNILQKKLNNSDANSEDQELIKELNELQTTSKEQNNPATGSKKEEMETESGNDKKSKKRQFDFSK